MIGRAPMSLVPGTRLGPYEIVSAIGAGGMGEVCRARDTRLDRDVAIKVLPEAFAQDADRMSRFEREAKAVAALSHPNILAIHDSGTHAGQMYVVTELLEGETLRARVQKGPMPVRKATEIAGQIARGLAAAHDKGIIHRDLKPENVFLLADGQVKILDFGIAKAVPIGSGGTETVASLSGPGVVMGTAGYMAPEQVRGQATDARTDLFAFGAVLYEMLSGRRAFQRDTAADTMSAILQEDPAEIRRDQTGRWSPPVLVRKGASPRGSWLPDGHFFVCARAGALEIVDADTGAVRVVYTPSAGTGDPSVENVVLAEDGRTAYFKSHDADGRASFWAVPTAGGRPRLLVRLTDPARASIRSDFAAGAGQLFFTLEDRQADIWMADITRR